MAKMNVPLERWLNLIVTSPLVLISTVDSYGNVDAMTARIFNPISYWPPMVLIGVAPYEHTYMNIRDTGEFVINIPHEGILRQVWIIAQRFPRRIDKIQVAGLKEIASEKVKPPRIEECNIHLECKSAWMRRAGDHYAIAGQVLTALADEDVLTEDHRLILESARHVHDIGFSGVPLGPDFVGHGERFHVNGLGSRTQEIAPFPDWLSEMKERGFLTHEMEVQISKLAEKLERGKTPEIIEAYKKKLTPLMIDIIATCYSAK